jgi:hypothetical protein
MVTADGRRRRRRRRRIIEYHFGTMPKFAEKSLLPAACLYAPFTIAWPTS